MTEEDKNMFISVIVPIYNEEKNIVELYERLKKSILTIAANYEFIFVNDGSKDNSIVELIHLSQKDKNVFYISLSRNFGQQIAISAGIDVCKGDAIVIIDGDLQDPPELIPELFLKYKEGNDVVYAKRKERDGESALKKITAKLFYRVLSRNANINIPMDAGDYRLIDKKIVEYLKKMPEQSKFIRGQIAWLGFKQTEVIYNRDKRKNGKSGYTYATLFRLAMNGITGFSDRPLQLMTKIGAFICSLSFLAILYAIYAHFILLQPIGGWLSLIISCMFIGGIQLLTVGIIGEYIGRMNKNILNRPLYIVEKSNIEKKSV